MKVKKLNSISHIIKLTDIGRTIWLWRQILKVLLKFKIRKYRGKQLLVGVVGGLDSVKIVPVINLVPEIVVSHLFMHMSLSLDKNSVK